MHELIDLVSFFLGISLLAVGGGNATLPAIQQHSVDAGWVSKEQFLHVYALGQVAPGPSTMYVAGIGFTVAGWAGAIATGLAFVVPSSIVVVLAGSAWSRWHDAPLKAAVRTGLAPVTVALITVGAINLVRALHKLAEGTARDESEAFAVVIGLAVAVAALAPIKRLPPAVLVLGSGLVGFLLLG